MIYAVPPFTQGNIMSSPKSTLEVSLELCNTKEEPHSSLFGA